MKKVSVAIIFLVVLNNYVVAQDYELPKEKKEFQSKAGLKAGYNINRLAGETPNVEFDNKSGFMVGAFYSSSAKSGIGYRSEIVFSRQGFSYDDNGSRQMYKQTTFIYHN